MLAAFCLFTLTAYAQESESQWSCKVHITKGKSGEASMAITNYKIKARGKYSALDAKRADIIEFNDLMAEDGRPYEISIAGWKNEDEVGVAVAQKCYTDEKCTVLIGESTSHPRNQFFRLSISNIKDFANPTATPSTLEVNCFVSEAF